MEVSSSEPEAACLNWKYRKTLETALWIPAVQVVAYEILHAKLGREPAARGYLQKIKTDYATASDGAVTFLFLAYFWSSNVNRKMPACIPKALGIAFGLSLGHCIGRVWNTNKEET